MVSKSALIVGNFLSRTPGSRGVCEELGKRLEASGWSITTTSREPAPLRRAADMVTTSWRTRGEFAVAQIDVYSGRAFSWAEAVCWTLRVAGKPFVLMLRGGNLPAFARRWPRRVRQLLASARGVIAPSAYLQERMRPYRDDIRMIPNPLEVDLYSFRPRERAEPRLVWLRAFHEVYNPTLGPKVARELAAEYPELRLTMIGPDKDGSLERTKQAAEDLGVAWHLDFPGGVPKQEVASWMQRGDVFLNTTSVDNTPVSVIEAMACGLCVVSTNVGGVPYLLEDERDALLVPSDDPKAMAGAVRRILSDPALARRLSSNAYEKARSFDWSLALPRLERELLSAARRSA